MAKRKKKTVEIVKSKIEPLPPSNSKCYEGDIFHDFLVKLKGGIETEKASKLGQLPDKIWIKQQFAIGVNDVTRVLERMPPSESENHYTQDSNKRSICQASLVPLQAVIVSTDCTPRLLTKHIPALASSRGVPVIFVRDNKESSIRLGELVNLKTAMAIGVKVRGSSINKVVDELLLQS